MGIIYTELVLGNFANETLEKINAEALVDTRVLDMMIPEHVAIQLGLRDLKSREVVLANGQRQVVRYVGHY